MKSNFLQCLVIATYLGYGQLAHAQNSDFGSHPGRSVLERFNESNRLTEQKDCKILSTTNFSGAFEADQPIENQNTWHNAGFVETKVKTTSLLERYSSPATSETLYMDFTALILRNAPPGPDGFSWDPNSTQMALDGARKILEQCNIRISRVRYFWGGPREGQYSFISNSIEDKKDFVKEIPARHRPMAIFAKDLYVNPEDHADKQYGCSFLHGPIDKKPIHGTMFIAAAAHNEMIFRKDRSGRPLPSRNTLAHELIHTLGFSGHCGTDKWDGEVGKCEFPDRPNLMSSRDHEYNESLPKDICELVRKSPLLRKTPLP
jgi:hypothetical protein